MDNFYFLFNSGVPRFPLHCVPLQLGRYVPGSAFATASSKAALHLPVVAASAALHSADAIISTPSLAQKFTPSKNCVRVCIMKKIIAGGLFFLIFFGNAYATGIGVSGRTDIEADFSYGAELNFKPDAFPFVFFCDFSFCNGGNNALCGGMDYWAFNFNLKKALNAHLGPEVRVGWDFCREKIIFENGFFVGLNGFVAPRVELYGQAAWGLQVLFGKSETEANYLNFPVKIGCRIWNR